MRRYCDPRCDFAWTPQKASEYISGKRDEARKEAPANATFTDASTISSFNASALVCATSADRGLTSIGGRLQDRPCRYKHWEAYGGYPSVPVERFAPFSAAQGASSLRFRARQTSTATLRAHEHARAADVPSLPRASGTGMSVGRYRGEPAPGMRYSDGARTQTKGCARSSG